MVTFRNSYGLMTVIDYEIKIALEELLHIFNPFKCDLMLLYTDDLATSTSKKVLAEKGTYDNVELLELNYEQRRLKSMSIEETTPLSVYLERAKNKKVTVVGIPKDVLETCKSKDKSALKSIMKEIKSMVI